MAFVEQKLLIIPEHPSSPPVFSGVRVTQSLVLYVCFVDRCLSICTFSFEIIRESHSLQNILIWISNFSLDKNLRK
jgi:hypothetical protein